MERQIREVEAWGLKASNLKLEEGSEVAVVVFGLTA